MRELARVRAQAARLRATRGPRQDEAVTLIDDALQLLDTLRADCAALQQRCTELERRIAAREAGGRRLLDALPQAIVTTDSSGRIIDANRPACLMLARSRSKLANDLLLHFAEDRAAFSSLVREIPHAAAPLTACARFRPSERAPNEALLTELRDPRSDAAQWLWLISRHSQP